MRRSKEPGKLPVTGLPKGMLATFMHTRGALDTETYRQIQQEARKSRETRKAAQRKRDAAKARRAITQFRCSGSLTVVPLRNVAGTVKVRTESHQRLMGEGFTGSDWAYDDESGCVRCRRRQIPKSHPDYGVWFDVGALLLGLKDGDEYRVDNPFDLMTLRLAR